MTTSTSPQNLGIVLDSIARGYGTVKVIENLSMSVKKGTIYGLLGPSGCGKTTLLKMIVGRLEPDSGSVSVLGAAPNTPGHGVPGALVGYSPQELALYLDLSIGETFEFHAKMHGMTSAQLVARKHWLMKFLELPKESRVVRGLSGGQQRRVSLAVALLHSPQLLILDEPTVGLDPLLRQRIWDHLREVAATGVTIIITTHYIEEARLADRVGLMRNGRLLAEGKPSELMSQYQHSNLEDVFLDLCRSVARTHSDVVVGSSINAEKSDAVQRKSVQSREQNNNSNGSSNNDNNNDDEYENHSAAVVESKPLLNYNYPSITKGTPQYPGEDEDGQSWLRHLWHILAISKRTARQLMRNPLALGFEILVPTVQVFLFVTCIGPDPENLPFAIVNLDVGYQPPPATNLSYANFGESMVQNLKKGNELDIIMRTDLNDAIDLVRHGRAWGAMYIASDYSESVFMHLIYPTNQQYANDSKLHLWMDLSDYQISLEIEQKITEAYEDTYDAYLNTSIDPVYLEPAVYGKFDAKFSDFLAPGMIATNVYAHAIGATAISFVREKLDSTMDRIFAAGVKPLSVIMGHFLTHFFILLIQITILLVVTIFGFGIAVEGSYVDVFGLCLVLGGVGMTSGLVISARARNEVDAVQVALALFFPALLLSGVMWPMEAIPHWFRWLSYSLPTTWVSDALRSVMIRGWGITHKGVWFGYVVAAAWLIFFFVIAVLLLKSTDKQSWWVRRKLRNQRKQQLENTVV